MKKEQEILLNPEEIQQLLEGGLYWKDIQPKLSPENSDNFKRHLNIDEDYDIEEVILSASVPKESEEKDVRAILLGEEKLISHAATSEEDAQIEEDLMRRRLFSYVSNDENELGLEQKEPLSDMNSEPKDSVLNTESVIFKDNEFKEIILNEAEEEEEHERERTPFGGLKLIILLTVVAACTFGFWYYFLTK